jgi:hypothetical protein
LVAAEDVKFYKQSGSGDGTISATEIVTLDPNRVFPNVTRNEQVIGEDYYALVYCKNTHQSEQMDNFTFWLDFTDQAFNDTVIKWGFDLAGINGTAQITADIYTAPTNVSWISKGSEPVVPNVGKLLKGEYFSFWVWWHINANAVARKDDLAGFKFSFLIPGGGSGTGGGTGEGPVVDIFGIKKFFNTKAGGREWFSTRWSNGHARSIGNNEFDPDDPDFGFHTAAVTTIDINGDGTATLADTAASQRMFVNGPAWVNTEITVECRFRTTIWDSLSLRSRSNHHGAQDLPYGYDQPNDISCGFGNYMVKWGEGGDDKVNNQVEVIHDLYSPVQDEHTFTLPLINVWTGFKQITRTLGNEVNVQGWINYDVTNQTSGWVKQTEFTYTGTNVHVDPTGHELNLTNCLNQGDKISDQIDANTLWTHPGKWCWLRLNAGDDMDIRSFSVREIEGTAGTGGGGGGGVPPPTPTNWKMAFVGDEGCGNTTNDVRDLCKKYDYTVSVGDHAYTSADCWISTFSSLKPNFNSAYGNHEYSEKGQTAPYKTFFGHSKTYFSFNFQNVHIVVIDSNIDMDPGGAQHNFVTADLATTSANSAIDWIFAVIHHPWFGASSSHSYNDGNAVQAFHSLFQTHKVALVLSGHNHNWQCSKQVAYNSGSPTNPTVFDGTPPFVKTSSGLIHVVTGTGGHDSGGALYSLGSQPSFQLYQNRTNNGIFEVVASNNGKTLTCSFVNTNDDKFNTFVITTT